MPNISQTFIAAAEKLQARAEKVILAAGITEAWRGIGADIHLVGSAKMGLMARRRDIDFHIYTDPFKLAESFAAMAKLAENPRIRTITYTNLLDAEDGCLEWHAGYVDDEGEAWQIDMIHILKSSPYAGYFERAAERISAALTPETRKAILDIKFAIPEAEKTAGIRIYRAVLEGGARDLEGLRKWEKAHPAAGIERWMP